MKSYIQELKIWFDEKVNIHQKSIETKYHYKKWDIWYVDFWINIWNEFNKIRPAVILTNKKYSTGNNIIIIPVTTFSQGKNILNTDVVIHVNHKSVLKLNHLRDISKKRLLKKIWRIQDSELHEIDLKIKLLFDIRT